MRRKRGCNRSRKDRSASAVAISTMASQVLGSGSGSTPVEDMAQYCAQLNTHNLNLLISLIVLSVVVLFVLSFTYHRMHLCKNVLWGVPGLVIPVNLLTPTRFRIVYAFMFGAMSANLLQLIRSGFISIPINVMFLDVLFNTILSPAIVVFFLVLVYFPVFACVDTPFPLVGHIVGLLYACLLVIQQLVTNSIGFIGCTGFTPALAVISGVGLIPNYVCYVVILAWYICHIVLDIRDIYRALTTRGKDIVAETMNVQKTESKYYSKYVTSLLRKKQDPPLGLRKRWMAGARYIFSRNKAQPEGLKEWLTSRIHFIFSRDIGLRLPLKLMGVLTVMLILLYQLGFLFFIITTTAGAQLAGVWENNALQLLNRLLAPGSNTTSPTAMTIYNEVLRVLQGITAVFAVSSILASTLCLILIIHMIYSVTNKLKLAAQGKFHTLVPTLQSPSYRMAASLKYAGFQIGFFVWAWLIYWVVFALVGIVLIVLVFGFRFATVWTLYILCYIFYSHAAGVWRALTSLMALALARFPTLWSFIVFYLQALVCKLLIIKKGGGKFIGIHNRRFWNWLEYVFFFYNAIVGLVASIFRIVLSVGVNLLLLFRLDAVILMKGWEFLDAGHKSFNGFLYLEYTYNNAVMNTFVKLMTDVITTQGGSAQDQEKAAANQAPSEQLRNKRARNRWLVAYTLLRNPSLQDLTASRIEEKKQEVADKILTEGETELEAISPISYSSETDVKTALVFPEGSNL